jgi:hypothetical protein
MASKIDMLLLVLFPTALAIAMPSMIKTRSGTRIKK